MKLYTVIPYSHRQQYAIAKELNNLQGVQTGSGWADALTKIGSVAGKIASNPAVQNLASAGLDVGASIAGNVLANKLSQNSEASNIVSSIMDRKEQIKNLYKAGQVSKNEALKMLKEIREESQSGGIKNLRSIAKHQHGRGNVMSIRPVRTYRAVDPISVNTAGGLTPQTGGILPAIPIALGAAGIGLLGSLLNPIIEKISGKYIASNIN